MVIKVNIGNRTATAPIRTQGETLAQDFVFLVFVSITNHQSKNKAKIKECQAVCREAGTLGGLDAALAN
jgi:hypothetical protein